MWNVKTKVTPVIIAATETISKSFRKYLSGIPGKQHIKESANLRAQKSLVLKTAVYAP
jgi:hypothetical protein